jgi:hypothetical protein
MIEPSRAAAFEPPVPLEPPPSPSFSAPKPPPIVAAPPPMPQPVAPPPMPRPIALAPPAPPPPAPIRPVAPPSPPAPALKLKNEAPAGYAPSRKPRNDLEDLYAPVAPPPPQESKFPWKLASAAGVLMVIGIAAGRAYWPAGSDQPRTVVIDNAAPAAATAPPAPVARTGRLEISTTPTGARIMLNGKHVGESPLALEVPAGRHTLTFAAKTGSVRKPIRVEAGKTEKIDISIFSGFIEVFAPILLDVSENGKSLGTTEQNRLMLSSGRHELTFSNRDLDYTSTHVVEIEPGDGKTLRLDPQGSASINASPWAEVWLGGKKIGDTPLANQALPLGTHELVFKYQQVEKRVTTTIRANSPVTISVDMLAKQ